MAGRINGTAKKAKTVPSRFFVWCPCNVGMPNPNVPGQGTVSEQETVPRQDTVPGSWYDYSSVAFSCGAGSSCVDATVFCVIGDVSRNHFVVCYMSEVFIICTKYDASLEDDMEVCHGCKLSFFRDTHFFQK